MCVYHSALTCANDFLSPGSLAIPVPPPMHVTSPLGPVFLTLVSQDLGVDLATLLCISDIVARRGTKIPAIS